MSKQIKTAKQIAENTTHTPEILIYSIYDKVTTTYNLPFYQDAEEIAKRLFLDACNTGTNGKEPTDFELYKIGTLNQETGIITPLEKPKLIVKGVMKHVKEQEE